MVSGRIYPRPLPCPIGNLVILEIKEKDGRHRMFRGFTVPMDNQGNFLELEKVRRFMRDWKKRYPDHTFVLYLKPDKGKIFKRR